MYIKSADDEICVSKNYKINYVISIVTIEYTVIRNCIYFVWNKSLVFYDIPKTNSLHKIV